MTIEEKRKALDEFCCSQSTCHTCVLYHHECSFDSRSDFEIEGLYSMVFGDYDKFRALKEEIVALRAENEALKASRDDWRCCAAMQKAEIEKMRAMLECADEKLRVVVKNADETILAALMEGRNNEK